MDEETIAKAQAYVDRHQLRLAERPGDGIHGIVYVIESKVEPGKAALKVHYSKEPYLRERDIYIMLKTAGIIDILGFHVPQLLDFDDELMALKMTIVTPPFVLDFAGAYLHQPPEFSDEVWEQWINEKQEQFGARWAKVQTILSELKSLGIHMLDPSPANIRFQ